MIKRKIAIIGDSLTYGYLPMGQGQMTKEDNWPFKLKTKLINYYPQLELEMVSNARPGRTISRPLIDFGFEQDNALEVVDDFLDRSFPFDLLIIFLGSNDYFGYDTMIRMGQGVNFNIAEKIMVSFDLLLDKIADWQQKTAHQFNYQTLIICPPKAITKNGQELLTSLPWAYEEHFNLKNIPVVNLQSIVDPQIENGIDGDGIHFTPQETPFVASAIYEKIINSDLLMLKNKE